LSAFSALATAQASAQELECQPCRHGFGKIPVGNSKSFNINLKNSGNRTLKLTSDSVQGSEFSIGQFALPIKLQPGASIQLPVISLPPPQGA
jgi:hypothetical protein